MSRLASNPMLIALALAVAVVQVFDILIHAASDQLEPIRVLSNVIVLLWLALAVIRRFDRLTQRIAVGAVGAYAVLNLAFIALEGLVNPINGQPRFILIVLISLSILLSGVLWFQSRRL